MLIVRTCGSGTFHNDDRLQLLKQMIEYHTQYELSKKIFKLHDHKGMLTVYWYQTPIDDEKDICTTLSGILSDEGYKVITANSVELGLKLAKRELPDVCFLDVWLPDSDGTETLEKLKALNSDLYV